MLSDLFQFWPKFFTISHSFSTRKCQICVVVQESLFLSPRKVVNLQILGAGDPDQFFDTGIFRQ